VLSAIRESLSAAPPGPLVADPRDGAADAGIGVYASRMGFGFEKLLVIGLVALFLIGPERLPGYATRLAQFVRTARRMIDDARDRVKEEMGADFDEEEWRRLDPRQYDPRRIIRDALLEPLDDEDATESEPEPEPVERSAPAPRGAAVFDSEAT
jgi:sec-independent protein translocase protein TatB